MIYIENLNQDAYFNLALEEYLIKNYPLTDDILLLWQNDNTIVIGRNQNAYEEINYQQVITDGVKVVRRLSGGGTVYQDLNNLNFTFISKKASNNLNNYEHFLQPIISVLNKLRLPAVFSGKNDIQINEQKISGNAQYSYQDRILHHGTILFNVDLTLLSRYLNVDPLKLQSKAIKSVQSRVTNILPLLKDKITIAEFKDLIIKELVSQQSKLIALTSADVKAINKLVTEKYCTWEWNYGKAPEFQVQHKARFENKGTVDVRLNITNGFINDVKFYGDFMGSIGTESIEQRLIGLKYDYDTILNQLATINISEVFGNNFKLQEIIKLII